MKITPYFLEGVYLALNAIPDVFLLVDSPRCEKQRAWKIGLWHDRFSSLSGEGSYARDYRLYSSAWKSCRDIQGSDEDFKNAFNVICKRHPDKSIFIMRMFLSMIINTDIVGMTKEESKLVSNPTYFIQQDTLDDDWCDGYRNTNKTIIESLLKSEGSDAPLICGFSMLRNEGDELGNVAEFKRLWQALDLPEPRMPFNGQKLSFDPISKSAPQIIFPFDKRFDDQDKATCFDLPIGIKSTCDFLLGLGRMFNKQKEAETLIAQEISNLEKYIRKSVAKILSGRGAIVCADPYRAYGLWQALRELGIGVPLMLSMRKSSVPVFHKAEIEDSGTRILVDPDFSEARDAMHEATKHGMVDVVVGSGIMRDVALELDLAYVENGFPCYIQHFLNPAPIMGFAGMRHLVERLDQAISERIYRSSDIIR